MSTNSPDGSQADFPPLWLLALLLITATAPAACTYFLVGVDFPGVRRRGVGLQVGR